MLELFANNPAELQNVYTPLPFNIHFGFCLVATLLYLVQYWRKKSAYYLFIMIAIDLTFITQYFTSKPVIWGLAVAEVVLIVAAVISAYLHNKKVKAENAEKFEAEKQAFENKKEAEKAQHENDKKVVDNAFEDEELQ